MKYIACAALLGSLLATGRAGADYLQIKVDLKNVTLTPAMPMNAQGNQGGAGQAGNFGQPPPGPPAMTSAQFGGKGFKGVQPQGPGLPPPPGGGGPPEEEHLWVTVYLEIKGQLKLPTPTSPVVQLDHQFGKNVFIPRGLPFLQAVPIQKESLHKDHLKNLKKWKDGKGAKDERSLLALAHSAWAHGLMKDFHATIDELKIVNPKHIVVSNYAKIQNQLKAPFADEEPSVRRFIEEMQAEGYRTMQSERGHYTLVFNLPPLPTNEAQVKRRLGRLEEALESFYFWFALQDTVPAPPMPRHRLVGLLVNDPSDFQSKHKSWGSLPMLADGFTPRRDNIMILCSKRQDEAYAMLERDSVQWRLAIKASHDELLNGDLWKRSDAKGPNALPYAIVQTMGVIQKAMEDQSERTTLSHEAVRQLLAASGLVPRNLVAPDWVQEGLASYFETPLGAVYGSGGLPSWANLVPFKHFAKTEAQGKTRDVLVNVISDRYFQIARQASADLADNRETPEKVNDDWERARATAWALVYHLVKEQKLDRLLRYVEELGQMPRDLELNPRALEGCFAKAFNLGDAKNALQFDPNKLQSFATAWFADLQTIDLELPEVQRLALQDRKDQAAPPGPKKSPGPKGKTPPPPPPPGN